MPARAARLLLGGTQIAGRRCATGALRGVAIREIAPAVAYVRHASNASRTSSNVRNHRGPPRPGAGTISELARASPRNAALAVGIRRRVEPALRGRRAHAGHLRIQEPLVVARARVRNPFGRHPRRVESVGVLDVDVAAATRAKPPVEGTPRGDARPGRVVRHSV
jgi:hypothetical protein